MLVVYQWFMYTVLALEVVPQAALTLVLSAVGGFLVWWVQLSAVASGAQTHDHHAAEESAGAAGGHVGAHGAEGSTEYNSALIALVSWSLGCRATPPTCSRLQPRVLQAASPRTQAAVPRSRLQPHV